MTAGTASRQQYRSRHHLIRATLSGDLTTKTMITSPAGSWIRVFESRLPDPQMVSVLWKRRPPVMLEQDLPESAQMAEGIDGVYRVLGSEP